MSWQPDLIPLEHICWQSLILGAEFLRPLLGDEWLGIRIWLIPKTVEPLELARLMGN